MCRDLAECFVANGHRVTVLTTRFDQLDARETINGVEVERVPVMLRNSQNVATIWSMLSYVPLAIRAGRRLMRNDRFNVINTYFAVPSGPAGAYLSRSHGLPNVLCILGGDIYDPSKNLSPHRIPGLKSVVRSMINGATRVVSESRDIQQKAVTLYGIEREIEVIPIGVTADPVKTASKPDLGLPDDRLILVTVGRLVARKNLHQLLQVFQRAQEQYPAHLVLIGDGPEKPELLKTVSRLGLDGKVQFTGRVDDDRKFEYLSAADVYVSTATHEGFGIVFLEAMKCGLPVICYNEGGQVEFLRDGVTGFVVELGDTERYLSSLGRLLENNELRSEMAKHNTRYIADFYVDTFAARYLDMFQEIAQ